MIDPVKMYMADGSYWNSLISPSPAPAAIRIGPWVFVQENTYLRALADPATFSGQAYSGPVSYGGEQDVPGLT